MQFFFAHTLNRSDLSRRLDRVPHPRKRPIVLNEISGLLRATTCHKYQAALSVAYGTGLRLARPESQRQRQQAHACSVSSVHRRAVS